MARNRIAPRDLEVQHHIAVTLTPGSREFQTAARCRLSGNCDPMAPPRKGFYSEPRIDILAGAPSRSRSDGRRHPREPASPTQMRAPSSSKSDGKRQPTRERGRPARMLCRCVTLSSLRWSSLPPCRREPHGPGRSRTPACLPVEPGREDRQGLASVVRAGRPRSRVGCIP